MIYKVKSAQNTTTKSLQKVKSTSLFRPKNSSDATVICKIIIINLYRLQ